MIIKCKMCGGDIQFNPGDTCGQCDHCGCTTTFPKLPDEQRANLFNRANHFRRQCEFDKAMAAYEHILEVDDTDAEAHWGIVLSKFGIEYVEDPVTHERIPTCHRAQVISILSDEDYQNAIKYAPDTQSRDIYEQEAKRIAEIQKGILAISSQEKPYDVFICYKETDDNGSRTKDSALAQEIYYQLTNEGYKVFFSRITLEDKLGQEYEPYIFAALNSAKVMLVVGTKPENFSAVWVKNEWSRFLAIMKNDRKRVLIPCYRDMDPYDLPEELSSLQSQDMSKIGFMQDLIHGVKKVLGSDKQSAPNVTVQSAGPGIASLHKRAVLFLEDSDWDSATEYFDRILDIDPEYAPAYIGKVQVKNKVRREADLARCREPISTDVDYQKALRFADEKQKAIYEGYNRAILDRIALERKEAAYREAVALESRAAVEADFLAAAKKFDSAEDIRDAKERAANCRAKASTAKAEAEKAAAVYKAQMERERKERERQEEERRLAEEKRRAEEAERQRKEEALRQVKRKRTLKICSILAAIVLIIGGGYLVYEKVIQPKTKYNQAKALLESGKYDEAVEAFKALDGFGDSATQIQQSKYLKAGSIAASGNYDEAIAIYNSLGEYSDSKSLSSKVAADKLFAAGDRAGAYAIYATLGESYQTHADDYALLYEQAKNLQTEEKYDEAASAFAALGTYKDSQTQILQSKYLKAGTMTAAGKYDEAITIYKSLGEFSDSRSLSAKASADKLYNSGDYSGAYETYATLGESYQTHSSEYAAMYDAAKALQTDGKYDEAIDAYTILGNYNDAKTQIQQCQYLKAGVLAASGEYDEAITIYNSLGEYSDSTSLSAKASADKLYDAGDYISAYNVYSTLGESYQTHANDYSAMYTSAVTLQTDGKYDEAVEAFSALGNYNDSPTQIQQSKYLKASALAASGKLDEAITIYDALGDYSDSKSLSIKASADKLFNAGDYAGAYDLYTTLDKAYQTHFDDYATMYASAENALKSGKYDEAYDQYIALGNYEDSKNKALQCGIEKADNLYAIGKYKEAAETYESIGFTDKASDANYKYAIQLAGNGEYLNAAHQLEKDLGYSDSREQHYQMGISAHRNALLADAYAILAADPDYQNTKEEIYQIGVEASQQNLYDVSVQAFTHVGAYKDAAMKLSMDTYALGDQLYNSAEYDRAAEVFESMGDFSDAATRVNEAKYAAAVAAMTAGQYDDAATRFDALGEYNDSKDKAKEAKYAAADALLNKGEYAEAKGRFMALANYSDSADKVKECDYRPGKKLYEEKKYLEALNVFVEAELAGYNDSTTIMNDCRYELAKGYMLEGKYSNAEALLDAAEEHKDSRNLANECRYQIAVSLMDDGKYEDAISVFNKIKDFRDSKDQIKDCHNALAKAFEGNQEYENAYEEYVLSDNKEKIGEIACVLGQHELTESNYQTAIEWFVKAGDYEEAKAQIISVGEYYYSTKQYDLAEAAYLKAVDTGISRQRLNELGQYYELMGDLEKARKAYKESGEFGDSKERFDSITYGIAEELFGENNYESAKTYYEEIVDYQDANEKKDRCEKHIAYTAAVAAKEEHQKPYRIKGNEVTFGQYEQDNKTSNGKEDIVWIVLDVKGDKSFLVSKYCLDQKPYHTARTNITWEQCSLRQWLNNDFLSTAFTDEEQTAIIATKLDNSSKSWSSTNGGNSTEDKVFLLSYNEAWKYFTSDKDRQCEVTAYAKVRGAYVSSYGEKGRWWLRTQKDEDDAIFVHELGKENCAYVDGKILGSPNDQAVRPAIWINLDSDYFGIVDYSLIDDGQIGKNAEDLNP